MTRTTTYKFKLKLTSVQEEKLIRWIGVCRYIYNIAKEARECAYKAHGINWSYYDLCKQLTELRQEDWIKEIPVHTEQDVLERLEMSFKNFFDGRAKYPKWASKDKYNSITFKSVKQDTHNRVKLPKIGSVKYFASREMMGDLKRATIIKEVDGFYICITAKQEVSACHDAQFCENQAIGIDAGISCFAVTSDGEYIENPRFLKTTLPELRRQQRSLSRKKKGGLNRDRQRQKVAKLHQKVSNQRKDFLHKTSTGLVSKSNTIIVENLNIKGMVRSSLGQAISDVAWGSFQTMLEYKCDRDGRTFLKVNPAYSSQECSVCGHTSKDNRLTQSQFKCVSCGHTANADEDAAKVILGRGTSYLVANVERLARS